LFFFSFPFHFFSLVVCTPCILLLAQEHTILWFAKPKQQQQQHGCEQPAAAWYSLLHTGHVPCENPLACEDKL
jgi:hypothetical protein